MKKLQDDKLIYESPEWQEPTTEDIESLDLSELATEYIPKNKGEVKKEYKKPYLNRQGDLIIPFDADPKYCYWRGGQHIVQTLLGLGASEEILEKYCRNWREIKRDLEERRTSTHIANDFVH